VKEKSNISIPHPKKLVSQIRAFPKTKGACPICQVNKKVSEHHIKPLSQGGSDKKINLVVLCKSCHDIVEEYAEQGRYYSPQLIKEIQLASF